MVHPNSGRPQFIRAYHGCYDPLAYSILYPGGETGWKDKSILLEEMPTIRFPRNRRKYTKRKTDGMTSTWPTGLLIVGYISLKFSLIYGNVLIYISVIILTDGHTAPSVRARTSGVRQKHVQPISQTTHSGCNIMLQLHFCSISLIYT